MLRYKIVEILTQAVEEAQESGKLPSVPLPEITVEHPQNAGHGDYASSFALKLARATGLNPLVIAKIVAELIKSTPEIGTVAVAPPGFINITLSREWLAAQVPLILAAKESFGNADIGQGKRVQLEFVSVNPTGPLHVGHGRGAILGDTLASVLNAAGYVVEKEYYLNDAGSQIDAFKSSVYARYRQVLGQQAEMPPDGYMGSYITDMAKELIAEKGDRFLALPQEQALSELGSIALEKMIAQIKDDLELLGVNFDVWFSEKNLYDKGQYNRVMSLLREGGHLAERENATWFVSTAPGEDKDNVVVRSDGSPTYFAGDIAYHFNKFIERKFDLVIDIWGADHQGHVSRMKAVVGALGISPERLRVIISQMVTLLRGEELVKISKRSGELITLREVIDEVGKDVCRFFFLCRSADSQMDFDLELAKKQSADNPVYYVQYAHARIASILRLAQERGIDYSDGNTTLLCTEQELALIRKMLLLPEIIEISAQTLEPHHLTYYSQDLATVFHSFYKLCRVISDDREMTKARLKLVEASKIVLARALHLMGMTAPDRM